MASSIQQLRKRWHTEEGIRRWTEVCQLISQGASRSTFLQTLEGFQFADENEGFIDLRGIPFSGVITIEHCNYFDFSFATKPRESGQVEIDLNLNDYRNSRFSGIRGGIGVLAGKVSYCDFSESKCKNIDWSLSGEIDGTNFKNADLNGSSFRDQSLTKCNFQGADLRDAFFSRVLLENCNFYGANLKGASFGYCEFVGTTGFFGADISDVEGLPEVAVETSSLAGDQRFYLQTLHTALELARNDQSFESVVQVLETILEMASHGENGAEVDKVVDSLAGSQKTAFESLMEDVRKKKYEE